MKRVKPIKEFCIGCRICELACITANSESGDLVIAYTEERLKGLSSCRTVIKKGHQAVAMSCQHCDDAPCITACIAGALFKDSESGRTEYDESKCVGCWSCVMTCPYGSIQRHGEKAQIIKCDLCKDKDMPACVAACPNQALVIEED